MSKFLFYLGFFADSQVGISVHRIAGQRNKREAILKAKKNKRKKTKSSLDPDFSAPDSEGRSTAQR